jgi:hypothetical protein
MTREDESLTPGERDERDEPEDAAMSALLKRSLEPREAKPPAEGELLRGVQKRIRARSRGKFYADGWSTSSSRVSYTLVAAVMLAVVLIAYFMLGPTGVSR